MNPLACLARTLSSRLLALLPALVALPVVSGCDRATPLTVGLASSTSHLEAGRLALEDYLGRSDVPPVDSVLVGEPSALAAPALRTAHRLLDRPGLVAVMGHSNSAASLATAPVYNEAEVVQLAPTSTAVAYSAAGPYSFRLVPPDDAQGVFLAGVLRDSVPAGGRVALSYVNDEYGKGLRGATVRALERQGASLELVLDLPHLDNLWEDDEAADYVAEAVAAVSPDAVLWLGRTRSLSAVLPRLADRLGPGLPVYGGDGLISAPHFAAPEEDWSTVRYVEFADVRATPASRAWADRYSRRYGGRPTSAEALSYDATALLLTAIEDGARSGSEVRAYLESLGRTRPPYPGITGPITFDERGNVARGYRLVRGPTPAAR